MTAVRLHLAIIHLPVLGILLSLGVLITGRFIRSDVIMRVGLWLLLGSGTFAIPAYFTGATARVTVERIPGVADAPLERHEDAAALSLASIFLAAMMAARTLFHARGGRAVSRRAFMIVAFVTVGTAGSMAWTAKLGGALHHTENSIEASRRSQAIHVTRYENTARHCTVPVRAWCAGRRCFRTTAHWDGGPADALQ